MKRMQNPLRLIAVVLIAMAAVSGYGLYQTMVNWAQTQETRVNFNAAILDDVDLTFGDSGHAFLTVHFWMNNTGSKLDVWVNEITFYAYATAGEASQSEYIGLGSRSFIDYPEQGIVESGETRDMEASVGIQNGTMYMDILKGSVMADGAYPIQLQAVIRFELANFPGIGDKLYGYWMGGVNAD